METPYQPGDRVSHTHHGTGHIVSVTEGHIVVRFERDGRDVILAPHKVHDLPTQETIQARKLAIRDGWGTFEEGE